MMRFNKALLIVFVHALFALCKQEKLIKEILASFKKWSVGKFVVHKTENRTFSFLVFDMKHFDIPSTI